MTIRRAHQEPNEKTMVNNRTKKNHQKIESYKNNVGLELLKLWV